MAVDRFDRRVVLGTGIAALFAGVARAQDAPQLAPPPLVKGERVPIWPATPPGGKGLAVQDVVIPRARPGQVAWTSVATPLLTVARPAKPNGGAIMLIPGGGYTRVGTGWEPGETARKLADRGYVAFELLYRLAHDGWAAGPDTPLQDAQRAIRVIRAGAGKRWPVDPGKIGIMGFSAGGHLAASLATRWAAPVYRPVDAADQLSARPQAAGLFFPVITMLDDGVHAESRRELLGPHLADVAWQRRYSPHLDVPADSAPCFISTNTDDRSVPARNSILMHEGLIAANVPSELTIFERGGHGAPAPRANGSPVPWLELFVDWTSDHGLPG